MITKEINPHFEEFIFDWNHKFYFLLGGYGSSKSHHCALKLLLKLLQEKRVALVVRQVFATLRDSCFSLFLQLIDDLQIGNLVKPVLNPMQLKFKNGSRIIFKGLDSPEKLKSISQVTIAWIEECGELNYAGFKEMLGRLRHPTLSLHFLLSTNPISKSNWIYSHFITEPSKTFNLDIEQKLYAQKSFSLSHTFYHHSTVEHNRFISQDYIEQLDNLSAFDPDLYRIARLGVFGQTGTLVFPQFEVLPHNEVISTLEGKRDLIKRVGMDFGFEISYNAVVRVAVDTTDKILYIYWEYYKNKLTDDITASELEEFKNTKELIYADSAEPKTIRYFCQQGFKMVGAKKFQGSRLQNTKKIKRFSKIVCSDYCPNAANEFSNLCFAKDRNGNIIEDQFNIDPHTLSAVWYALDGFEFADLKKHKSYSGSILR